MNCHFPRVAGSPKLRYRRCDGAMFSTLIIRKKLDDVVTSQGCIADQTKERGAIPYLLTPLIVCAETHEALLPIGSDFLDLHDYVCVKKEWIGTDDALGIIAKLCRMANSLRVRHLVHRDIGLHNLRWNPLTKELRIVGSEYIVLDNGALITSCEPTTCPPPEFLVSCGHFGTDLMVWSIGRTLFKLCTGTEAFENTDRILWDQVPLDRISQKPSDRIKVIISECMKKNVKEERVSLGHLQKLLQ